MKSQRLLYLTILAMTVLRFSPAQAGGAGNPGIRGEISFTGTADTVFLVFKITPEHFEPDSIRVTVADRRDILTDKHKYMSDLYDSPGWIVYRQSDTAANDTPGTTARRKGNRLWVSGRIPTSLKGNRQQDWQVLFLGYYTDPGGRFSPPVYESACVRTDYFGFAMEIPVAYGYFKSDMASPLDKEGLFLGLGWGLELGKGHWRFTTSTSWSGLGKNFTFSEPFRFGVRYYTGTRSNFMPQFYSAVKLSKLMLKRDDVRLRELDWGGEFGIATEGPFERLGYHYSTALDGYHSIELFLSVASGQPWRAGTKFELRFNEDIWEVRVSLNAEGWYTVDDVDLARYNNRPLPHKILAMAGAAPILILKLPGWLADL